MYKYNIRKDSSEWQIFRAIEKVSIDYKIIVNFESFNSHSTNNCNGKMISQYFELHQSISFQTD